MAAAIMRLMMVLLTLAYVPLKFHATMPPPPAVERTENVLQWEPTAHSYCKKSGDTVPIPLRDYGFKLDFKPSTTARCRGECAQRPDCQFYTYGQWNKAFQIFGFNINWGKFYGQMRCQLYETCDEGKTQAEWDAAMTLYKKPDGFVYTPPPPDHNFHIFATLATSVVMAVNLLYVFKPKLVGRAGDKLNTLLVVSASLASIVALQLYGEPDNPNNNYFVLLVLAYLVNCGHYLLKVFTEEDQEELRMSQRSQRSVATTSQKSRTIGSRIGPDHFG